MKRILLLSLLLLPIVALAQYPTFSNKQKLGVQTTGDGLIYRGTTINIYLIIHQVMLIMLTFI